MTVLRFKRYTTSDLSLLTGTEGELFVDLDKDTVVVQDGVTAGGKPLATEALVTNSLATKADTTYVDAQIAALVDSAPGALDTLNELAAALNDDANFATTITNSLATKADAVSWGEVSSNATVTANSKNLVDTSAGALTITLPASPALGTEIMFIDAAGQAATNNITVNGNGEKIQGLAEDLIINVNRAAFQVVYHNTANGWVFMEV